MKVRRKPIIFEAILVKDVISLARTDWLSLPEWLRIAYEEGNIVILPSSIYIQTLEGRMRAEYNDWIIRGIKGELHPIKPDIFEETYEIINE